MWNSKNSLFLSLLFFGAINFLSIEEFYFAGTPALWFGFMMVGALNPYLSVQMLVASQILANPMGPGVTSTQLFTFVWFAINAPVLWRNISTKVTIPLPVPFFVIAILVTVLRGKFSWLSDLIAVILTCWITYFCYRKTVSYTGLVRDIVIGSFIGAMPFIMSFLGLSYFRDERQASIMEAHRGGLARFAAGVGDFNYIGACMLVGLVAAIAMVLCNSVSKSIKLTKLQSLLFAFFAGASCFSIMGTLSRSAIAGIVVSVFVVLFLLSRMGQPMGSLLKVVFVLCVGVGVLYIAFYSFFEKYVTAILQFATIENTYTEGNRANLARMHLQEIMRHPFLGGTVYFAGEEFAAHNTFIQMGTNFGVLGALTYFYYVIIRPLKNLGRVLRTDNIALYAAYLMCIYSMLSLSLNGWKIFWMLWTMITVNQAMIRDEKSQGNLPSGNAVSEMS